MCKYPGFELTFGYTMSRYNTGALEKTIEEVMKLAKKFHSKNITNADSYLTIPRSQANAFFDLERKFQRLQVQMKLPEAELQMDSFIDNIEDLAIYAILFKLWLKHGARSQ